MLEFFWKCGVSHWTPSLSRFDFTQQRISKAFICHCVSVFPGGISFLSLLPRLSVNQDSFLVPICRSELWQSQKEDLWSSGGEVGKTVLPGDWQLFACPEQGIEASTWLLHPSIRLFSVDARFLGSSAGWRAQDFSLVVLMVVFSSSQPSQSHHQGGTVRAKGST